MDKFISLKAKAGSLLLKISRMRIFRPFIKYFFDHMTSFLPVNRIHENDLWIAFYHPDPDYPLHIIILPKRSVKALTEVPGDEPNIYSDLFELIRYLITEFHLSERGYRLITNGGPNQTIPQWHWHLISENAIFTESSCID